MAWDHRTWRRAGGGRVLCLGHRHETRRHPRAGCSFLRDAFTLDRISDSGGLCTTDGDDRHCRDPDCRRRHDRSEGYGVEKKIVGWVERSDTHQLHPRSEMMGIATLDPSYEITWAPSPSVPAQN